MNKCADKRIESIPIQTNWPAFNFGYKISADYKNQSIVEHKLAVFIESNWRFEEWDNKNVSGWRLLLDELSAGVVLVILELKVHKNTSTAVSCNNITIIKRPNKIGENKQTENRQFLKLVMTMYLFFEEMFHLLFYDCNKLQRTGQSVCMFFLCCIRIAKRENGAKSCYFLFLPINISKSSCKHTSSTPWK